MALTKDQKTAQIKELTKKFQDAESVMFTHYIGLSVLDVSEFRRKLTEGEAEMKVAKKTLIKIAAKEAKMPEFDDETFEGPISCIFSFGDALSGAQISFKFSKEHEEVELMGGVFEGKVLSKEQALELAKMPSRDVLLATFVGMLQSPLTSFASICSSPLSGFARAMSELAKKAPQVEEKPAVEEKAEVAAPEVASADEQPKEESTEKPAATEDAPTESGTEEPSAEDTPKPDSVS